MNGIKIGTRILDLPPGPGNPRNSEGAFLTLTDGRILFIYSRFVGDSCMDHATTHLMKMYSADGGSTWTEPEVIFTTAEHEATNIMSVSLMRMLNGDVGLFYLIRKTLCDMRPVLRRSSDEGETWSDYTVCVPRYGYFVINNDRATRLSDGRIVLPLAEHFAFEGEGAGVPHYSRASVVFFFSDDDGRTWHEAPETVAFSGVRSWAGLQEPGIVERKNGVLWAHARTDLGRHYEFFSVNGGTNWTGAAPSRFTGPCSPLCIKRMPDERLFAVWNPIPEYETRVVAPRTGGRTPLVCAVSADDGLSWSAPRFIEDDPGSGYCYTAIHFTEDGILLAYCAGNGEADGACLNRLRFTRIGYGELDA